VAQPHLGDEPLEAIPPRGRGPRLALVAVDYDDRSWGQPNATARWRSAYCRAVLSVFSKTWRSVD